MMLHQHQGLIGGGGGGGNSGDSAAAAAAAAAQAQEYSGIGGELGGGGGAGSGGFSEEERGGGRIDDGERNSGGNRWPRQETLALLKIRSDMDTVFRDSSLKGPLWDEVSRKLAELGYHRSAKKCKEKFENVYKYHKRTKDGRTSKADGKTYRFFDQLEALETTTHPPPTPASAKPFLQAVPPMPNTNGGGGGGGGGANTTAPPPPPQPNAVSSSAAPQVITTVPSSAMNNVAGATVAVNHPAQQQQQQQQQAAQNHGFMFSNVNAALSNYSTSSSSSTDSEEPVEKRRKRKRKWKDFFGKLMKEVIDKQEELQSKFLETLEKRERERIAREEAWRVQEMAKMNREHDMLVQERSIAAAKDAAVISFLQKIAEQQQNSPGIPTTPQSQSQPQSQPPPTAPVPAITPPPAAAQIPFQLTIQPQPAPPPPQPSGIQQQRHQQPPPTVVPAPVPVPGAAPISLPPVIKNLDLTGKAIVSAAADNGGGGDLLSPSPSRWPKAEVQALINLRTTLDVKYQENGPKGPLWEEISSSMKKLGYNRNAKRCKEKWENINKYYKKVKESSKKRPEDSKTCPYFHQLDAIYREKANSGFGSAVPKPENQQAAPIMARPEQQWPPSIEQQRSESAENMDQNDEDEDDDDDEDEAGEYEIVTNKTSTMATSIE